MSLRLLNARAHIYYEGDVQGVGFRFTAERIAVSVGLAGWAKNLRDGRVEVVCEGAEDSIKVFLEKIDSAFKAYIKNVDIEWSKPTGEFKDFEIRLE